MSRRLLTSALCFPPALPNRPEQVWSADRPTRLDNVAKDDYARLDNTLQSDSRFVYPDGSDFRQSIAGYEGNGPTRRAGPSSSKLSRSNLPLPEPAPQDLRPLGGYGSKSNAPAFPLREKEVQKISSASLVDSSGGEMEQRITMSEIEMAIF